MVFQTHSRDFTSASRVTQRCEVLNGQNSKWISGWRWAQFNKCVSYFSFNTKCLWSKGQRMKQLLTVLSDEPALASFCFPFILKYCSISKLFEINSYKHSWLYLYVQKICSFLKLYLKFTLMNDEIWSK